MSGLERIEIVTSDKSQFNIDPSRYTDRGSSCCVEFVTQMATHFMKDPSALRELTDMEQLEKWCLHSVRAHDAMSAVEGMDVMSAMAQAFPLHKLHRRYVHSSDELLEVLQTGASSFALILTAVPKGIENPHKVVGNSSIVLSHSQ